MTASPPPDANLRRAVLAASLTLTGAMTLAAVGHPEPWKPLLPCWLLVAGLLATWGAPRGSVAEAAWPVLCWPALYDGAVRAVEGHADRSFDAYLAAADRWLTGGRAPDLFALGGPVEELANAFYVSYWVVLPLGAVYAYTRAGEAGLRRYSAALLFAFTTCALGWLLWPAGGWHPSGSPTSPAPGPFTGLARAIYQAHPHAAAAFPSSHAALAFAAAGSFRQLGAPRWWWLWAAGVAWSTFQGQYHYLVDAPPGALLGWLSSQAVTYLQGRLQPGWSLSLTSSTSAR